MTKKQKGSPSDIHLSFEGLPYRGPVVDFKDKDPISKQPVMRYEAHVDIFDLSDTDQKKAYQKVVQKLVTDEATMSYEEKEYDAEKKTWRILIVYTDMFYTAPKNKGGLI